MMGDTRLPHPEDEHRSIALTRGRLLGWDLPLGPASDPDGLEGLAAMASKYLSQWSFGFREEQTAASGWHCKHTLTAQRSSFSFWTAAASDHEMDTLLAAVERRPSESEAARLRRLATRSAQRAAADPVRSLFAELHEAAWGERKCLAHNGTESSIAAIDAAELCRYLDRNLPLAQVITEAPLTAIDRPESGPTSAWSGTRRVRPRDSGQVLIAVQHRLAKDCDEIDLALIAEILGNRRPGTLFRSLRARDGLAYSTGALCGVEHGWPTVAAYAVTSARHASECERRITESLSGLAADGGVWTAAARRVVQSTAMRLDTEFADLDEQRCRLDGRMTPTAIAAAAEKRAQRREAEPPHLLGEPASAAIGPIE